MLKKDFTIVLFRNILFVPLVHNMLCYKLFLDSNIFETAQQESAIFFAAVFSFFAVLFVLSLENLLAKVLYYISALFGRPVILRIKAFCKLSNSGLCPTLSNKIYSFICGWKRPLTWKRIKENQFYKKYSQQTIWVTTIEDIMFSSENACTCFDPPFPSSIAWK